MGDLQASIEFLVELYKFYNVDLFIRGYYQFRFTFKPPKTSHAFQVEVCDVRGQGGAFTLFPAFVTDDGQTAVSRTINIYYKDEEVLLKDVFLFRVHLLIDSTKAADCIEKTPLEMNVDVHFTDQVVRENTYRTLPLVTSRTLKFHLSCFNGLHHQVPLLFDYYYFSVLDLIIHANVVCLGLPNYSVLRQPKTGWFNKSSTPRFSSSAPTFFVTLFGNRYQLSSQFFSDAALKYAVPSYSVGRENFEKASAIHRNLCAILAMAHAQLLKYFEEMMQYLDEKQRIKLGEKLDPADLVEGLCKKLETLQSCEEVFDAICSDLSVLNNELALLWSQFQESFALNDSIRPVLREQHHRERMLHFSEAFFICGLPWKSLLNASDSSVQKHTSMGQSVKSSKYLSIIPPVTVECADVDGDSTSTPIFFEDRYVSPPEASVSEVAVHLPGAAEAEVLEHKPLSLGILNEAFHDSSPQKTDSGLSDEERTTDASEDWFDINIEKLENGNAAEVDLVDNEEGRSDDGKMGTQKVVTRDEVLENNICLSGNDVKVCLGEGKLKETARLTGKNLTDCHERSSAGILECGLVNGESFNDSEKNCVEEEGPKDLHAGNQTKLACASNVNMNEGLDLEVSAEGKLLKPGDIQSLPEEVSLLCGEGGSKTAVSTTCCLVEPKTSDCKSQGQNDVLSDETWKTGIESTSRSNSGTGIKDMTGSAVQSGAEGEAMVGLGENNEIDNKHTDLSYSSVSNNISVENVNSNVSEPSILSANGNPSSSVGSIGFGTQGQQCEGFCDASKEKRVLEKGLKPEHIIGDEVRMSDRTMSGSVSEVEHKDGVDDEKWLHMSEKEKESEVRTNSKKANCKTNESCERQGVNTLEKQDQKNCSAKPDHNSTPGEEDQVRILDEQGQVNSLQLHSQVKTNAHMTLERRVSNSVFYERMFNKDLEKNLELVKKEISLSNQFSNISMASVRLSNSSADDISCFCGGKVVKTSSPYGPVHEVEKTNLTLQKAKQEVKSRMNYCGMLYSDVNVEFLVRPYFIDPKPDLTMEPVHFVICVHGLEGNSGDLRLLRCFLEMALPATKFEFLMSEVNQDNTFLPFDELTEKLVSEILHHMEAFRISPSRISFIGHSLGNIIIRAALTHPLMEPYVELFHTFLSLSGPHLGMIHHTSSLVSTGLWLMQKWKKSASLLQLSLNDASDMRETFLYKLSKKKGLEYFTNVLLVSSVQDHYVPFHSSRIELPKTLSRGNSQDCAVYREMMENILTPLLSKTNRTLVRYSVYHCLPSSTNSFIGRAAHIAMLDSELFIEKLICRSAAKYFQ